MDLGILNTLIAVVIVLLVLSLLVQSVQTLLKKLFKLKSRQIENSLKDLYDQAIAGATPPAPDAAPAGAAAAAVPAGTTPSPAANEFTTKVLDEFKKIGRVTMFGNVVLDSLSKEDLFKVMGKMESENFFPDYVAKFQLLCTQIIDLRNAIEALTANPTLRGVASSKIAAIRNILAPIFNDVEAISQGTQVKPRVLFGDLLRLSKLDIRGVLNILDEAQQAITQEKDAATKANAAGEVAQLQALSAELAQIAKIIGDLGQKFDDAVSPLRSKLQQVELWFDTVTHGFEERYSRHMKTASILISVVVVIVLNANFFRVYKNISQNQVQQNLILESGPAVLGLAKKAEPAVSPTPAATPPPRPSPTPAASPTPTPDVKKEIEQTKQDIAVLTSTYEGFGFTPLSWQQIKSFSQSLGFWTALEMDEAGNFGTGVWGFTLARNDKGVVVNRANKPIAIDCQEVNKDGKQVLPAGTCTAAWRVQTQEEWWASRRNDILNLIGWAIMIMLLSVGAPFWQDTLESLFGIKNLLRQKSATQNIETQSGTGQTKQ